MPNSTQEIITRADLDHFAIKFSDWVRKYVKNNQEVLDMQPEVLRLLDEINNEEVGNNGAEKAQIALNARILLYGILTELGHTMDNVSFEDSINLIRKELEGRGILTK